MRLLHGVLFGLLLSIGPSLCSADIAINSVLTIKPGNPDNAAQQLITQAQKLKGYFITRSSASVILKVPGASAAELHKFVEDNWLIYQQDYQAQDVSARMIDIKSRLKAKEELLDEYQKILDSVPMNKIVNVATAVTKLVEQIELLRGNMRVLEHQTQYATVTVNFNIDREQFDRQAATSSFPWLNTLGVENLLQEFAR